MGAMRALPTDTMLQHEALMMTIVNVAGGSSVASNRRKRRAIAAGIIGALLEAIDLHTANASVAHDCLVALSTVYSIEGATEAVRHAPRRRAHARAPPHVRPPSPQWAVEARAPTDDPLPSPQAASTRARRRGDA